MFGRPRAFKIGQNVILRCFKVFKKGPKAKNYGILTQILDFWAFFAHFEPTQKNVFKLFVKYHDLINIWYHNF